VAKTPPPTEPPPPVAAAAPQTPLLPDLVEAPGADQASIEKAREAVRLKMQTLPPSAEEIQSYLHHAEPITAKSFPPMAGPALPISVDKQQQLDGLLLRYKADQITPEQYQSERARILAQQ
jgi:hypothetical protein